MGDSYDIDKVSIPRLALLKKGSQGYGFNLHGDKTHPGQTISAVDKDSPAEIGGLREGDRVIEVNGVNVEDMTHGDVVKRIKENPNEATLLVCDKDTLAYLKQNNRACSADLATLQTVVESKPSEEETSVPSVVVNGDSHQEEVVQSSAEAVAESAPPPAQTETEDTTTPEEVKELSNVLDEQDTKPEEPAEAETAPEAVESVPEPANEVVSESAPTEPPKPTEPEPSPAEPEPTPAEPSSQPTDDGLKFDMNSARPKKKNVKVAGGWSNKVSVIDSL